MSDQAPVRIEKYWGQTREEALRAFATDAPRARRVGYRPTAQTWDGEELLVTYELEASPALAGEKTSDLNLEAVAIVIGGAMVAAGSVLPWITATGGFGISVSRSGIEGGDGFITIALGIAIVILGLHALRRGDVWAVSFAASLLALAMSVFEYFTMEGRIRNLIGEDIFGSVGIGIWIMGAGALIAASASLRIRGDIVVGGEGPSPAPPSEGTKG